MGSRTRSKRAGWYACVVLAWLCSGRADAQPGSTTLDEEPAAHSDDYDRVVTEAIEKFNAHKYEQARALFAHVHELRPSARTLRGLGLSDLALERYVLAREELEAALLDERRPLTAEQRRQVTELLGWMQDNLATVRLHYAPSHAQAKIDQRPVSSGELMLETGLHELQVTAPGFEAQQQRFQLILSDTPLELSVELAKLPAEPLADAARASPAWLWVGLPSLLATLTGAGFLTAGLIAISDAEDPNQLDRVERFYERSDRGHLYTTLGLSIGGVGLAGMITAAVIKLNDAPAGRAEAGLAYHVTVGRIAVTRSF